MADSSRKFINNHDLHEQNSFTHLLESIHPESDEASPLSTRKLVSVGIIVKNP